MPKLIHNKRILDLSRIIVGPYASLVLSGFGCQVIKVQSPLQGDPTRLWGPPWNNNTSTYFQSVNCNKKSISLNLKQKKCRQVLYKLVKQSDVVLQNFIPGVTKKLQIDYDTLVKHNQKIIYCSVSGYGDIGSKMNFPAFDNIIQAQTGFMHLTGNQSQPYKLGFAITDVLTALYASNAILAGLVHLSQTNKGIHLKTSLYECAIACLINQGSNYLNGNTNPQRLGNHHPNIVPYGIYKTKDINVIICVGTNKQYDGLLKAIKKDNKDKQLEMFDSNQKRVKNRIMFDQFLNKELEKFNAQQVIKLLDSNKVPCGRVNDLHQVFNSQLTKQLKMVQDLGQTKMIRNPIRTHLQSQDCKSYSQNLNLSHPPKIGQHNNQILKQLLGMSQRQVEQINKLSQLK